MAKSCLGCDASTSLPPRCRLLPLASTKVKCCAVISCTYPLSCHVVPCFVRYALFCHLLCHPLLRYACCPMMGCAMLRYAMPCYAMPCYALVCSGVLCCAMPCHAMPCYAMLCHAMPCYAMLCYATLCYGYGHERIVTSGETLLGVTPYV